MPTEETLSRLGGRRLGGGGGGEKVRAITKRLFLATRNAHFCPSDLSRITDAAYNSQVTRASRGALTRARDTLDFTHGKSPLSGGWTPRCMTQEAFLDGSSEIYTSCSGWT
jgi:hypothetical protein